LLDANKDGLITRDDWKKNITFDTNHLVRSVILDVKKKNYKITEALQKMGIEGKSQVDIHTLQKGLKKLSDQLTNEQAFFLSRYISKGKTEVSVE
jgi:Ca2+-binding EF-hand superfamily protein